jgi:hypothetical protein
LEINEINRQSGRSPASCAQSASADFSDQPGLQFKAFARQTHGSRLSFKAVVRNPPSNEFEADSQSWLKADCFKNRFNHRGSRCQARLRGLRPEIEMHRCPDRM